MTAVCFFAGYFDAGDYSILPIYRACRDARRRVETGCFPRVERGVWGASPPHSACTRNRFFAYQPQVTRRREPSPMPFAYHCQRGVPYVSEPGHHGGLPHHHIRAQGIGVLLAVRGNQHGHRAGFLQRHNQRQHFAAKGVVESAERFVQE